MLATVNGIVMSENGKLTLTGSSSDFSIKTEVIGIYYYYISGGKLRALLLITVHVIVMLRTIYIAGTPIL